MIFNPAENETSTDFQPAEIHLGNFLASLETKGDSTFIKKLSLLLSRALAEGDTCVSLPKLSSCFEEETLLAQIENCEIIGKPGEYRPLVFDSKKIYFQKSYEREKKAAENLRRLAGAAAPGNPPEPALLNLLFPADKNERQRLVAQRCTDSSLTILSGGPGTGKTTAMARIVLLLLAANPEREVALCAPTGKAAARMNGSLESALVPLDSLSMEEPESWKSLLNRFTEIKGTTIHRLLRYHPEIGFRFNKENPLPYDLVVVDECSMLGLDLFYHLLSALKEDAALLLIGDRNQLASVEAGALFSDLCLSAELQELPGISFTELITSWRFQNFPGIGRLAAEINSGTATFENCLAISSVYPETRFIDTSSKEAETILKKTLLKGYQPLFCSSSAEEALENLNRFKVLSPLKMGEKGVNALNERCRKLLSAEKLLDIRRNFPDGEPLLILENDYHLGLSNGDSGVFWNSRACFRSEGGEIKTFLPGELPSWELGYASTVHKSQGSEWDEIALLLPDDSVRHVSRELIYTAVTRARLSVSIFTKPLPFLEGVKRRVERVSGLREKLTGTKQSAG